MVQIVPCPTASPVVVWSGNKKQAKRSPSGERCLELRSLSPPLIVRHLPERSSVRQTG